MKNFTPYQYSPSLALTYATVFDKYNSDKAYHHAYNEVYAHLFIDRKVSSFLEIGLFLNENEHTDLHAWVEIFPKANIYGADWNKHLLFSTDKIKTFYVDQSIPSTLEQLKNDLPSSIDVILDDASHNFERTISTFEALNTLVAKNGLYLIEDILSEKSSQSTWQQNIDQLVDYFFTRNYNFEVFATSALDQVSDSLVLAVYF